ncbi:MAG: hypothetical protein OER86_11255, partial [Phycisphaerae bacterium]|nr:hypothetical protein [Phycisphaerae bacterium]
MGLKTYIGILMAVAMTGTVALAVTFAALLSNLKKAEGVSDAHATSIKIVEDLMNGGSSLLPLLERNQATLSQDDRDYLK